MKTKESPEPHGLPDCPKCRDIQQTFHVLKTTAESFDEMLTAAVNIGLEDGRILGLLEAVDALEKAGYKNTAKVIKDIVGDEMLFKKFYGSC